MKPTQIAELFANIKKTFVSFFSILMFVALGMGVFLGISWAGPALQNAADDMFRGAQFHNFQMQYPYGFTDDELKQIEQVEGVTQIEAERQSFQTLKMDDRKYTVKVQSLGQVIDVPIVREGNLPTKPGELALHAASAKALGLGVGDTITFEHDAKADSTPSLLDDSDSTTQNEQASNDSGMQYLTRDAFKVTAIIDTADYAAEASGTYGYSNSPSGAVDALAWVPDDSFDAAAYQNGYPIVNVTTESLAGLGTFSDEYKQASAEIQERIEASGDKLSDDRFGNLAGKAEAKLLDAEKQLADAKKKIADGEKELADGRAELEAKKAEGEQKLADGLQELEGYEAQRADAEVKLANARAKVEEGEASIAMADEAKAELRGEADAAEKFLNEQNSKYKKNQISLEERNINLDVYGARLTAILQSYASLVGETAPDIDHTNFPTAVEKADSLAASFDDYVITYDGEDMTIGQARVKLAQGRADLNAAQDEYNQRVAQLDAGWAEYYAGQDELNRLVAEGEQKIADGEKEVADAKALVAENEPKVKAAREQFDAMKSSTCSVMPRAYNAGVVEVSTFSSVTDNLSRSMAALFIIVGLLVSYFAVSRIVHEQVTQIGTKKALGFRKGEITMSFLLYSGIAVLVGAIIGALIGYLLVEGIIGGVLAGMFAFGEYAAYFGWVPFFIMLLLEMGLILGATYLACRSILKQHAIELLRGEKPPTGKLRFYEKWAIWEKLPLFVQTIVNNCVNDKRRMLSTIVGVAGSTALIVTAITLNNDVMKSYDEHYLDAYGFNAIAYCDPEVEGAVANLDKALEDEGATTAQVFMKSYLMQQPDGESAAMRIVVPADESSFEQVYYVNPIEGEAFDPSAKGAWVSQAYADHMGAKVGDVITINDGEGAIHEVPILGFYTFWLTYHEMVMGPAYFKEEFKTAATPNAVLAQTGDVAVSDIAKKVSKVEGFDSILDDATGQHGNFETFSSVSSAVVAIYLVLAALMAIVVLLNLNVMFIEEKKRELIVLMINGFSVKDAKNYISYDSIVLTAIGIIVGLILGCIMGSITVNSIEPSTGVFVQSPDLWAIIIGIVGSALLALIMSKIALRRIPAFKLTDINKQ